MRKNLTTTMPTKLKIKENIKKSKNGLENLLLNKRNSPSFPPPKKVKCFQCQTNFYIKFVISRLAYSQKNNWGYWTEQEKDKGKPICNDCLRQIYQDKVTYWQAVQNSKKRALFRVY